MSKHTVKIGSNSIEFDDAVFDKKVIDYLIQLGLTHLMHSRFQAAKRGKNLNQAEIDFMFKRCAKRIQNLKVEQKSVIS